MIKKQIQINYTIEFTEVQLKELYQLLDRSVDDGRLTHDYELMLLYQELKENYD